MTPSPKEALELHTICDDCGKEIMHDKANWADDGSSYCPSCRTLEPMHTRAALATLPPSDRTADVTVEQAARKCADDLVLIVEAATKMAHRTGNTFVIDRARVASMIAGHFDAFTVRRR